MSGQAQADQVEAQTAQVEQEFLPASCDLGLPFDWIH
jgi:hypothetical protein